MEGKIFETKDSGVREQFASGMVRDTQDGKPRFDLVFDGPVIKIVLIAAYPHKADAIQAFFDWYEMPNVYTAAHAVHEIAKLEGGLFLLLERNSGLMIRGAIKYTERNWMQANGEAELKRFTSSACRHFTQYICGFTDEDHGAATWFNLNGAEYVRAKLAAV